MDLCRYYKQRHQYFCLNFGGLCELDELLNRGRKRGISCHNSVNHCNGSPTQEAAFRLSGVAGPHSSCCCPHGLDAGVYPEKDNTAEKKAQDPEEWLRELEGVSLEKRRLR